MAAHLGPESGRGSRARTPGAPAVGLPAVPRGGRTPRSGDQPVHADVHRSFDSARRRPLGHRVAHLRRRLPAERRRSLRAGRRFPAARPRHGARVLLRRPGHDRERPAVRRPAGQRRRPAETRRPVGQRTGARAGRPGADRRGPAPAAARGAGRAPGRHDVHDVRRRRVLPAAGRRAAADLRVHDRPDRPQPLVRRVGPAGLRTTAGLVHRPPDVLGGRPAEDRLRAPARRCRPRRPAPGFALPARVSQAGRHLARPLVLPGTADPAPRAVRPAGVHRHPAVRARRSGGVVAGLRGDPHHRQRAAPGRRAVRRPRPSALRGQVGGRRRLPRPPGALHPDRPVGTLGRPAARR